ncbi:MAG: hypothetical protein HGA47_16265, partial [Zoogloea sp.]|nr:hypothetical protein [Zoogloea sp.]
LLWMLYGLRRGELPLVLTNGVILLAALAILVMKRRFGEGPPYTDFEN